MPKGNKRARSDEKKSQPYKRYKRSAKSSLKVTSLGQGFVSGMPKMRRVHQRYAETVSVTSTVGVLGTYQFRANSPYDPNYSGAGHQPMGFDQMAALYNHYVVLKSKIRVNIVDAGSGTPLASVWGIHLSDGTPVAYTDESGFIEANKGPHQVRMLRSGGTGGLYKDFNAITFFDIKQPTDNDQIGAEVSTNPAEQALFQIWYRTLDGSTCTAALQVTIDYWIEFREPQDLAQS